MSAYITMSYDSVNSKRLCDVIDFFNEATDSYSSAWIDSDVAFYLGKDVKMKEEIISKCSRVYAFLTLGYSLNEIMMALNNTREVHIYRDTSAMIFNRDEATTYYTAVDRKELYSNLLSYSDIGRLKYYKSLEMAKKYCKSGASTVIEVLISDKLLNKVGKPDLISEIPLYSEDVQRVIISRQHRVL